MELDYKEAMAKQTDEALVEIVVSRRGDYEPAALEAAEAEMTDRGLEGAKLEKINQQMATVYREEMIAKSQHIPISYRLVHLVVDTIAWKVLDVVFFYIVLPDDIRSKLNKESLETFLADVSLFFIYYIAMEFTFRKTLGKFITRTSVANLDGTPPNFRVIFIRTLCRLIPFDGLTFFSLSGGFHDRLSKTKLVRDVVA